MKRFLVFILILTLIGCSGDHVHTEITIQDARKILTPKPTSAPAAPAANDSTISIASFNIQVFGKTKADKPEVMDILAQAIQRFDVVVIQEIHDSSGTAIEDLEAKVDALGTDYEYIIGPRLGRTSSKEQYAFIYNTVTVEPVGTGFTADDPQDIFHREPFIGHFRSKRGNFDFLLMTIPTDPDEAKKEINAIPSVIQNLAAPAMLRNDFIILGDPNAHCNNFDENSAENPFNPGEFNRLINNSLDTNPARSGCTYDRIIITSQTTEDWTGKVGVYRFDEIYNLTPKQAKKVSGHYPVWAIFIVDRDTGYSPSSEGKPPQ